MKHNQEKQKIWREKEEQKQLETQLKECTFQPKVNKNPPKPPIVVDVEKEFEEKYKAWRQHMNKPIISSASHHTLS